MRDIDFNTLKSLNVLYVEDEVGIREEMKLNFSSFFNSFKVASDGLSGLELFDDSIDLVITDIKMPNMDGLTMVDSIKSRADVLVIVITAFKEVDYLQKAIDLGVDGYISKPIESKKLLRLISKISSKIVKQRLELELKEINKELQNLVEQKVNEILQKDNLLARQSKYALMGQMVGAIAHQLKTPISIINVLAFNLSSDFSKELSRDELNTISEKLQIQTEHLIETIDELRYFFKETKDRREFYLIDIVESAIYLLQDDLKKNNITIKYDIDESFSIDGYPNEFTHIFLNLIQNSKDAFIQKDIQNRNINIKIDSNKILFLDNAKGINDELLDRIFELNFTTKDTGTGLGLHLCRLILQKIDWSIEAKNSNEGLLFEIKPK
jgi:signal transduction histidine kinase